MYLAILWLGCGQKYTKEKDEKLWQDMERTLENERMGAGKDDIWYMIRRRKRKSIGQCMPNPTRRSAKSWKIKRQD